MQPTIRQLQVFLAVARAGSFRRAAEVVHLSQPALSQHVAELERGLGTRLLDRKGRAVTLTEAGRILQEHGLRALAALAGAREAIAELGGQGRGTLVIGASTTPGIYLLPGIIGAFERQNPAVSVQLRIANSRVIEEQVRANELDLGVVGGHGLWPGEECLAAGVLDRLVLIVPADHPWVGQSTTRRARSPPAVGRSSLPCRLRPTRATSGSALLFAGEPRQIGGVFRKGCRIGDPVGAGETITQIESTSLPPFRRRPSVVSHATAVPCGRQRSSRSTRAGICRSSGGSASAPPELLAAFFGRFRFG